MALRNPDSTVGPFRERDTPVLRATFMDNASPPVFIPNSSLVSATLTLYSEHGEYPIINNRDGIDIKPQINAQGELTFPLTVNDMVIVDDSNSFENHRALIEWVWNTDKRGSWEIRIVVKNVHLVP